VKRFGATVLLAALLMAGCSDGGGTPAPTNAATSDPTAGLAVGSGRLTGRVGPGRPAENGAVPALVLTFRNGDATVQATEHDGTYTVDLPAGTWEVHADDGNLCARGLRIVAGAAQSDDLLWPAGGCQDLGGPPSAPAPPAGPTPRR